MENFDDVFNDDELNKILQESGRKVRKNSDLDFNVKEVGDRVCILDYSSISHVNGENLFPEEYEKFISEDYFIVINTRLNKEKKSTFGNYKQDLMIGHPKTNEVFRIASRHVKLKVFI